MDEKAKNGKSKAVIGLLAVFLTLGALGAGYYWYYTSKYVSTDDARISGTIVNVSSKVSGKVMKLLVAEGDTVKAGQTLAVIDPKDILTQKAQAEAGLAMARANYEQLLNGARPQEIQQARSAVDQAKANLDNAALTYQRMQKLFEDRAISASQRDNAQTAYQVARESYAAAAQTLDLVITGPRTEAIQAAAAQVKQAEASVEALKLVYGDTTIVSPLDGVVAIKSVNGGEVVMMGQPLFSIVSVSDLWVNARIEETHIGKLKVGQTVDYTIDGYPGRTFSGPIYEIGQAASSVFALIPTENASNNYTKVTQRIPIKICLPEKSGVVFRPGMSAVIKIHLE